MEVANETGTAEMTTQLRELKKGQDVLGDLHDRQALLDELPRNGDSDTKHMIVLVRQMTDAEIEGLHKRYLSRRDRLLDIAHEAQGVHFNHSWKLPSLAAGAIALSSGAYLARQRLLARHSEVNQH